MPLVRMIREFRTIRALLENAERIARGLGEASPGAEHLLLSALDLPDGSARRAFERLGRSPDDLPAAIASQHRSALASVGILVDDHPAPRPLPDARGVFRLTPPAQAAFRRAVELSGSPKPRRLLGAHVLLALSEQEHGTVPRALTAMGIDRGALADAARAVLPD